MESSIKQCVMGSKGNSKEKFASEGILPVYSCVSFTQSCQISAYETKGKLFP
jgi:hypothetical protein